jgi:hypothetical protein
MAVSGLDEEQLKKNAIGSGSGAYVGSGAGGTAATGEKPTSSGSFTNLTSYLDANRGNDARMGAAIGERVGQQGNAAQSAVSNYQTAGNQAITAGTQNVDQSILGDITRGTPVAAQNVTSQQAGAQYTGPGAVDASYKGPGGFSDVTGYGNAAGAVDKLTSQVSQVQSGQIDPFLKDIYGTAQYNQGENLLDTFLTKSGAGGQAELDKIGTKWGGQKSAFEGINKTLQGNIDQAKQTSKDTQKRYDDEIAKGQGAVQGVDAANANAWQEYQDSQKPAATLAEPPAEQAPAPALPAGYDPFAGGGNYNVDFGYVNKQVDDYNRSVAAPAYNSNMAGNGTFGGGAVANASNPTTKVDQRGTPRPVTPQAQKQDDKTIKYPGVNKIIRGR